MKRDLVYPNMGTTVRIKNWEKNHRWTDKFIFNIYDVDWCLYHYFLGGTGIWKALLYHLLDGGIIVMAMCCVFSLIYVGPPQFAIGGISSTRIASPSQLLDKLKFEFTNPKSKLTISKYQLQQWEAMLKKENII